MHVYATRSFRRFQRKEKIADATLFDAVARADDGLIDADLGGGLIKQRVARKGQGKRCGYRTILAYRSGERAVFLYGFAKNQRDNIGADELETGARSEAACCAQAWRQSRGRLRMTN